MATTPAIPVKNMSAVLDHLDRRFPEPLEIAMLRVHAAELEATIAQQQQQIMQLQADVQRLAETAESAESAESVGEQVPTVAEPDG